MNLVSRSQTLFKCESEGKVWRTMFCLAHPQVMRGERMPKLHKTASYHNNACAVGINLSLSHIRQAEWRQKNRGRTAHLTDLPYPVGNDRKVYHRIYSFSLLIGFSEVNPISFTVSARACWIWSSSSGSDCRSAVIVHEEAILTLVVASYMSHTLYHTGMHVWLSITM